MASECLENLASCHFPLLLPSDSLGGLLGARLQILICITVVLKVNYEVQR